MLQPKCSSLAMTGSTEATDDFGSNTFSARSRAETIKWGSNDYKVKWRPSVDNALKNPNLKGRK